MATLSLTPDEVTSVTSQVLTTLGTPEHIARVVAHSLVAANSVGHDSHGIVRLLEYSTFVTDGRVIPAAEPTIVSSHGAVAVVDGNHGWGQYASNFAVDALIERTREFGTATVTIRNCNHIGRLGEYAERLADAGLSSVMWCNADPSVAPFGGRQRVLGTNPIAAGIPVANDAPIVLDFATAAIAEGKVRVARATGSPVEPGAIIDRDGRPSTTPSDFYDGGALLAFGGHKGYGLSVLVELLGGALSGNHPSAASRYKTGNGVVMVGFDPTAFTTVSDFDRDITEAVGALRGSTPVDSGRPVLLPGDIERQVSAARRENIPVAEEIWSSVNDLLVSLT